MATKIKLKTSKPLTHVDVVDAYLWGSKIGAVALDPTYGFYVFRYTPEFAATRIEPAPLHMPVNREQVYMFTDLPTDTYKRLPAMLGDALPDDFGNALVDRYMAEHGIARSEISALDRLAYMSNRAMGALQFKPARGPKTKIATTIQMSQLVNQARLAVKGTIEDDDHATAALRNIIEVGTSAGGARAKAVIAWNRDTQEIRAGQLEAAVGFEYWLLKFDGMGLDNELGASKDYGRIEYAYYLMAKEAGIDMMESRLLSENGRAHFMTKRFDRELGDKSEAKRHHIQTLCAMSHLDYKKRGTNSYAQYFQTVDALGLPYGQKEEAFRRMVFNVMSRNCDDHSKNFSFRLRQGNAWELSPAYDITFAHNPKGEWTNQHLMSVNGKFNNITFDDMLEVADRFGIGNAKAVIAQVRKAITAWEDFAVLAGVQLSEYLAIGKQHILMK